MSMLTLAPLDTKYYATRIANEEGEVLFEVGLAPRNDDEWQPSLRERNLGFTEDDVCDNHYENTRTYDFVMAIIESYNSWYRDDPGRP